MRPTALMLVVCLATGASCSAVLVRPLPPGYEPSQEPRCRAYFAPIVDSLVTAVAAGLFIYGRQCTENQCVERDIGDRAVPGGVLFGISAIYGFSRAGDCRRARRQHAAYEPFPHFAARTFTAPSCQLSAEAGPDHGRLLGTVTKAGDVTEVDAVFRGAPGGSWACDPISSQARARAGGARRKACLILQDDCVVFGRAERKTENVLDTAFVFQGEAAAR